MAVEQKLCADSNVLSKNNIHSVNCSRPLFIILRATQYKHSHVRVSLKTCCSTSFIPHIVLHRQQVRDLDVLPCSSLTSRSSQAEMRSRGLVSSLLLKLYKTLVTCALALTKTCYQTLILSTGSVPLTIDYRCLPAR